MRDMHVQHRCTEGDEPIRHSSSRAHLPCQEMFSTTFGTHTLPHPLLDTSFAMTVRRQGLLHCQKGAKA